MRIFGGHDYYDCGMAMGRDPDITLVRGKSRPVTVRDAGGSLLSRYIEARPRSGGEVGESVAVVLGGKVYRGFLAPSGYQRHDGFWSADKLQAWAAQQKAQLFIRGGGHYFLRRKKKSGMTLEQYFAPTVAGEELRNWMINNRVSIMVERMPQRGEDREFEVNRDNLKGLGFAKAVDPYTAFQELSMWIGGVLGGVSPEIVTIKDDVVLVESHGFDRVTSFRGPRVR